MNKINGKVFNKNRFSINKLSFILAIVGIIFITGCSNTNTETSNDKIHIVATTTMLADLAENIGGDTVSVEWLMGPGIDPHLYQASAGDVARIQGADVILYNGLHLEGKMDEIFASLDNQDKIVICIEDGLNANNLLPSEDDENLFDPHIWFDVTLWQEAASYVTESLSEAYPHNANIYEENLQNYMQELDELDAYIFDKISELPEEKRVLITAHDAFAYFGNRYGFTVMGLQGISTEAEVGTYDLINLAEFITENEIKAIFLESSVPPRTIEALQAAVHSRGFEVEIGGELYSDSLGDVESGTETYILTFKANVNTIVDALK